MRRARVCAAKGAARDARSTRAIDAREGRSARAVAARDGRSRRAAAAIGALALGLAAILVGACGGGGGASAPAPRTPASATAGLEAMPGAATPAATDDPAAVRVVTLTAQPALVQTVRAAPADLAGALSSAILGLVATAQIQGLDPAGPPFARYLSRGDAADPAFVVEAGLPVVKPPAAPPPGAAAGELPAGPAATLIHVGRHEDLGRAHAALDAWLVAHHRRAAGPRWEVFLTNPATTPDPAQQRTLVVAPLAAEAP